MEKNLGGKQFKQLDEKYQDKILYYQFRTITIKKESSTDLKFEIFERLNIALVGLNDQELRNCIYRGKYIEWLARLSPNSKPISECNIQTTHGVKVADVAWATYDFFRKNQRCNPYLEAPEIEILSLSNTRDEMNEKKDLYFAQGTNFR